MNTKNKKLYIIQSYEDMIKFVLQSRDCLGDIEWELFWGFELRFDKKTGSYTEDLEEYLLRGGRIKNIPDKFPCVILFTNDKMVFSNEDWIYIGVSEGIK